MKNLLKQFIPLGAHIQKWVSRISSDAYKDLMDADDLEFIRTYAESIVIPLFDIEHKTDALKIGENLSNYRGQGLEFDENRVYQAGDQQRQINWRLYARTQTLYSKVYTEERKTEAFLVVDRRATMRFATQKQLKVTLAAKIALCYAYYARHHAVNVSACIIDDKLHWLPENNPRNSIYWLEDQLVAPAPPLPFSIEQPSIDSVLSQLLFRIRPGNHVIIISDFSDININSADSIVSQLAHKHSVEAIQILDPTERQLNVSDRTQIVDETEHAQFSIDASDKLIQKEYNAMQTQKNNELHQFFTSRGIKHNIHMTSNELSECVGDTYVG